MLDFLRVTKPVFNPLFTPKNRVKRYEICLIFSHPYRNDEGAAATKNSGALEGAPELYI